jgi:hypothetical protein
MRAVGLALLGGELALFAAPARAADPTIGDCLLAAEASLKLRSEHKLRQTRTQLLVCSSASCPSEVRQECMKRMDEVNTAAATIVLAVKNGSGQELSKVKVTVDGQLLTDHLDGSALSVDPGAHEFTFEVAGEAPLTKTIILHEGEKDRRETVIIGAPVPPAQTAVTPAAQPGEGGGSPGEAPSEGAGSTLRVLGITSTALGVAGLGAGGVLGALASSAWHKAQGECPSHTGCSSQAMNDRSTAVSLATGSTIAFIAGGVLAAGGLTLFFVAPKGTAATVGVQASPGGILFAGGF